MRTHVAPAVLTPPRPSPVPWMQLYEFELAAKNRREGEKLSREYAVMFQDAAVKERMTRCAIKIQSLWRGHKARQATKPKKTKRKNKAK